VTEIESTLAAELDLQREGANASVLRRNWLGSRDLYVPEPIWSHTAERVLTLERVRGIPSDDIAALDAAGIDRKALAAKGVRVFYTQVFRDNFFHADAHAGNIWVDIDPARKSDPRFIALDFGIMGQLSGEDQNYLAENFMAIFNKDYRRIALSVARGPCRRRQIFSSTGFAVAQMSMRGCKSRPTPSMFSSVFWRRISCGCSVSSCRRAIWNSLTTTSASEISLSGRVKYGSQIVRTAASSSSSRVVAGIQPART
jgi:hypothetical protein